MTTDKRLNVTVTESSESAADAATAERCTNLVDGMHVYRDGAGWVIVETRQPEQHVRIGTGITLAGAYDDLSEIDVLSTGPDSGLSRALVWAARRDLCHAEDELTQVEGATYSGGAA